MDEVSAVDKDIQDRLTRIEVKIESLAISMAGQAEHVKAIREDIDGSRSHAERLTRMEQRQDDAEKSRQSMNENIRWLIGLVIMALLGVAGLFFKTR